MVTLVFPLFAHMSKNIEIVVHWCRRKSFEPIVEDAWFGVTHESAPAPNEEAVNFTHTSLRRKR